MKWDTAALPEGNAIIYCEGAFGTPNGKTALPSYPIHRIERQIEAIEIVSGKRVVAITLNHENLRPEQIEEAKQDLGERTGLPVCDPLTEDLGAVVNALCRFKRPCEVA